MLLLAIGFMVLCLYVRNNYSIAKIFSLQFINGKRHLALKKNESEALNSP